MISLYDFTIQKIRRPQLRIFYASFSYRKEINKYFGKKIKVDLFALVPYILSFVSIEIETANTVIFREAVSFFHRNNNPRRPRLFG